MTRQQRADVADRHPAPRERSRVVESYEQRQGPERRERCCADQKDGGFAQPTRARSWSREGRHENEHRRRRHVRRVSHDDRRQRDEREAPGPRSLVVGPADENEREQGQQCPSEPRGQHPDVNAAFHSAGHSRRECERDQGAGKRQPTIADGAQEQDVHGDAGSQPRQPQQGLVDQMGGERAEREPAQEQADIEEAGRIELHLGVPRPPAGVPRPRRRASREHVPEPIDLAGMVVERGECESERRSAEAEAIRQEQRERDEAAPRHGDG